MKGCLLVAGIFVAAIALFAGILWFFLYNSEDQNYLTEQYPAKVISAEPRADRYDVVYSYASNGKTYYGTEWFYKKHWDPNDGLCVCADPESPRTHAPTISGACGQTSVGGTTREAELDVPTD